MNIHELYNDPSRPVVSFDERQYRKEEISTALMAGEPLKKLSDHHYSEYRC